jgi:hypothetical protein
VGLRLHPLRLLEIFMTAARLRRTASRVAETTRLLFILASEAWKMARRG